MVDYCKLTRKQLYKLVAMNNKGVLHFIYDKYAAALYGLIVEKVAGRQAADEVLYRTFMFFVETQPNAAHALPSIFIRLNNIAASIMDKESIMYPIRTEANIQSLKEYV